MWRNKVRKTITKLDEDFRKPRCDLIRANFFFFSVRTLTKTNWGKNKRKKKDPLSVPPILFLRPNFFLKNSQHLEIRKEESSFIKKKLFRQHNLDSNITNHTTPLATTNSIHQHPIHPVIRFLERKNLSGVFLDAPPSSP